MPLLIASGVTYVPLIMPLIFAFVAVALLVSAMWHLGDYFKDDLPRLRREALYRVLWRLAFAILALLLFLSSFYDY